MSAIALVWLCTLGCFLAGGTTAFALESANGGAQIFPLTSRNRSYPGIMFGGWGPHLRAPMRNLHGALWFVTDAGPDVLHNEQIVYHRFDGKQWIEAARVKQISGIQQNVASVMCGDLIYSYGISIRAPLYVEQCEFDTVRAKVRSCAEVRVGGKSLVLPLSCNYIGAAVSPSGKKIVWWTTVGVNGGPGKWSYIFERNGSWGGPVISSLNPFNDFGYVFASFADNDHIAIAGQLFAGAYPRGTYAVGAAELKLGDTLQMETNFHAFSTNSPGCGKSASDIWTDGSATHILAETHNGSLACYFKPAAKGWIRCDKPVCVLTNVFRARFLETTNDLYLITGAATGGHVLVRSTGKRTADAPIDWNKIPAVAVNLADREMQTPAAIYVESRAYQTAPLQGINFGLVGHYPEDDTNVVHVQLLR